MADAPPARAHDPGACGCLAAWEFSLLYGLLDRVSRAASLEEVFEVALDVVQEALRVDRSAILLCDSAGVMRFRAWRGLSDGYRRAVEGHSPWACGDEDPQPVVVADADADPSLEAYRALFREEGIGALGFIPLRGDRGLLGKFMVYGAAPRSFTPDELRLASTIASQVAQTVLRKTNDAEVARLYAEAEAANRMKDEFLAVVSHELRTPLNAIVGWASVLQGDRAATREKLTKGLEVIHRNARAQARLVDDILDVSRIVSGKLVLDPRPTSLVTVVTEALDAVRASAIAKDVELAFEPPDDPFTLEGDAERLRQIAWNLLSNSVKFTPSGGRVTVRLGRSSDAVAVEIEDTGRGIAREFLPHVFERFRQADGSTTRHHGGLGLGLAIVRHLVEAHGGRVEARSDGPGRGSTFVASFPVTASGVEAPSSRRVSEPPARGMLDGARVLVVDDEADARDLVAQILEALGAEVRAASTVTGALDELSAFRPDAVVSDIGMPDEDGYALLRRMRARPDDAARVPAIALTAYARADDAAKALAAGFTRYVAKPADPAVLARAVAHALGRG